MRDTRPHRPIRIPANNDVIRVKDTTEQVVSSGGGTGADVEAVTNRVNTGRLVKGSVAEISDVFAGVGEKRGRSVGARHVVSAGALRAAAAQHQAKLRNRRRRDVPAGLIERADAATNVERPADGEVPPAHVVGAGAADVGRDTELNADGVLAARLRERALRDVPDEFPIADLQRRRAPRSAEGVIANAGVLVADDEDRRRIGAPVWAKEPVPVSPTISMLLFRTCRFCPLTSVALAKGAMESRESMDKLEPEMASVPPVQLKRDGVFPVSKIPAVSVPAESVSEPPVAILRPCRAVNVRDASRESDDPIGPAGPMVNPLKPVTPKVPPVQLKRGAPAGAEVVHRKASSG